MPIEEPAVVNGIVQFPDPPLAIQQGLPWGLEEEEMDAQMEARERNKGKDQYPRVWNKLESLFRKRKKYGLLEQVMDEMGIQKGSQNRQSLELIFRHPLTRAFIARMFYFGQYRREIVLGKKKCSILDRSPLNSARNLLRGHCFDVLAFIQGGSDCRSSLRRPLDCPEMGLRAKMV